MEGKKVGISGQKEIGASGNGQLEKLVIARIATQRYRLADRNGLDRTRELRQKHGGLRP